MGKDGKMTDAEISEMMAQMPEDVKERVKEYIAQVFDATKKAEGKKRHFEFKWAGALSHLKDKYTSVELQHRILEMW